MKKIDRLNLAALDRQASGFQKVWLRGREVQRTMQIAANADVRRRWIESDSFKSEESSATEQRKETDHDSRDSSG